MTRTCIVAVLVVLGTLAPVCASTEEADLYESPSFAEARAMATETGKPVLIHFHSPG
jgi:hypothetical protein